MQEATRVARIEITAESGDEAVREFREWKRDGTRELKVNINKTKLIMMGEGSAVRPQKGRYPCGVCGKGVGANSIWHVNVVKRGATRDIRGTEM